MKCGIPASTGLATCIYPGLLAYPCIWWCTYKDGMVINKTKDGAMNRNTKGYQRYMASVSVEYANCKKMSKSMVNTCSG